MSQLLERLLESGTIKPSGVIHLGAEWCQESAMYANAGAQFVLWAEASQENLPTARRALAKFPDQVLVDKVVWSESGLEMTFNIYNHRSSNSLFDNDKMQVWYPEHRPIHRLTVQTICLDDLVKEYWREGVEPTLLAMDLQGAELKALMGGTSLLKNPALKFIVTEAVTEPLYKGGCLLHELDAFLAQYGFIQRDMTRHTVSIAYPHVGEMIARGELDPIPQFDVLYVRASAQ